MKTDLWKRCLECSDKCCGWQLAFPLFVTPEEKSKTPDINTQFPCKFYTDSGLCDIHLNRPFDCRFFPFDILEIGSRYFWITWKVNCPILTENRDEFETYLEEHERELIPKFRSFIKDYSQFRLQEFLRKYKYEVLRETKV
jgi:Fe-S-cluster containining protein